MFNTHTTYRTGKPLNYENEIYIIVQTTKYTPFYANTIISNVVSGKILLFSSHEPHGFPPRCIGQVIGFTKQTVN
jgi:hypothetical protein